MSTPSIDFFSYVNSIDNLPAKSNELILHIKDTYTNQIELGEIIAILLMAAAKITGCDYTEQMKSQFVTYYSELSKSFNTYYKTLKK